MADPGDPTTTEVPTSGAPRWVKVFGIIAIVVAVLAIISMLVGGGHGPGRHLHSGLHATTVRADRVSPTR